MDRGSSSGPWFVFCDIRQIIADYHDQKHLCDCGRVADIKYLVECRWCKDYIMTPELSILLEP